jgi:hypothetical protein
MRDSSQLARSREIPAACNVPNVTGNGRRLAMETGQTLPPVRERDFPRDIYERKSLQLRSAISVLDDAFLHVTLRAPFLNTL